MANAILMSFLGILANEMNYLTGILRKIAVYKSYTAKEIINSLGGIANSLGGIVNSLGGIANSLGGIANSLGGIANSLGGIHGFWNGNHLYLRVFEIWEAYL